MATFDQGRTRRAYQRVARIFAAGIGAAALAPAPVAAAAPSVTASHGSPVIAGNIGTATAGVKVDVTDAGTGARAATATTTATGAWTASLPAPLSPTFTAATGIGAVLSIAYAGTKAPPAQTLQPDTLDTVIPADGRSVSTRREIHGAAPGRTLPCAAVSVNYRGTAHPTAADGAGGCRATVSAPLTTEDAVSITTRLNGLTWTAPAPVTGTARADSAALDGAAGQAPSCLAEIPTGTVLCAPLPFGKSFTLVRRRTDGQTQTRAAVVQTSAQGHPSALVIAFGNQLLKDDRVTLLTARGRTIGSFSVRPTFYNLDDQGPGSSTVYCPASALVFGYRPAVSPRLGTARRCGPDGRLVDLDTTMAHDPAATGLRYALSGALPIDATLRVPEVVPAGPFTAFADVTTTAFDGMPLPLEMRLAVIPADGGPSVSAVSGTDPARTGLAVPALRDGRYLLRFTYVNRHGDTRAYSRPLTVGTGVASIPVSTVPIGTPIPLVPLPPPGTASSRSMTGNGSATSPFSASVPTRPAGTTLDAITWRQRTLIIEVACHPTSGNTCLAAIEATRRGRRVATATPKGPVTVGAGQRRRFRLTVPRRVARGSKLRVKLLLGRRGDQVTAASTVVVVGRRPAR